MKSGTTNHPKFRALMRSLKLPQYVVVGLLESLWMLASQFADDGDLSRFDSNAIADFSGFEGDAEALMDALVECRWIDRDGDTLRVHDWEDHCPDYIYDRRRKRRKRDELRSIPGMSGKVLDNPGKSPPTKPNHTKPSIRQSSFVPPKVEEVKAYCLERGNSVDAEQFMNHYTSNGWMKGKSKIRDWKAAVRTWEKNDFQSGSISGSRSSSERDRPELRTLTTPQARKATT